MQLALSLAALLFELLLPHAILLDSLLNAAVLFALSLLLLLAQALRLDAFLFALVLLCALLLLAEPLLLYLGLLILLALSFLLLAFAHRLFCALLFLLALADALVIGLSFTFRLGSFLAPGLLILPVLSIPLLVALRVTRDGCTQKQEQYGCARDSSSYGHGFNLHHYLDARKTKIVASCASGNSRLGRGS